MRYVRRVELWACAVLAFGLVLASGCTAFAAPDPASSITTSPVSADLSILPGQSKTTTLQVLNNGTQPISIGLELKTFSAHGNTGQANIINTPVTSPVISYVHFSQTTFTALPGVWTPVQMTISLPSTANLGYYYAVIFRPVLPSGSGTHTNNVTLSNAVLVLVDTGTSNEVRRLEVSSFTTSKKIYEYLPSTFNVTVRNTGNIYVAPEGSIFISRTPNAPITLANLALNKAGGRVLPDSSRVFSASWSKGFPEFQPELVGGQPVTKKNGTTVEQLHWNFSNLNSFRFGKYYARLALVYSNGQRDVPIYGTVSFWVIPWKLMLIALVIVLIPITLFVMALRYRHMYRKNSRARKAKDAENL